MAVACLAKLSPLDPASGSRVAVYISNWNDPRQPDVNALNGHVWEPCMIEPPVLGINLWQGDYTAPVEPGGATLGFNIATAKKTFPGCDAYVWAGAPVEIYAEEAGTAWPWTAKFKGVVQNDGYSRTIDRVSLRCKVDSSGFEKNVLTAVYAGTGGIEGGADLKNRAKPLVLGWAQNVEPVLIDATNSVYQFSGYGAIEAVTTLYERGSNFGAAMADHANYTALVAATITPGRWATCLASGLIRLGAPAFGVITGDIKGHKFGGSTTPRLTGAAISALATHAGVTGTIASSTLTALDAAAAFPINRVIVDQIKWLDLAGGMIANCNWQSGISLTGSFFAAAVSLSGTEAITLKADGTATPLVTASEELACSVPYFKTTMGAARSWRVHSSDEIAYYSDIIERGLYSAAEFYRDGNLVDSEDGSRWIYINAVPGAGNAPPAWPTTSNSYWRVVTPPLWATPGAALGDSFVLNAGFWSDTSLWTIAGSGTRVSGGGSDPASYIRCTSTSGYAEYKPTVRLQVGQRVLYYSYWRRASVATNTVVFDLTFLSEAESTVSTPSVVNLGTGGYPLGVGDSPLPAANNEWYLVIGSLPIPMNAAKFKSARLLGTPDTGETIDVTGLMLATNEQSVGRNFKLEGIDTNATAADNMIQNAAMRDNANGFIPTNTTRTAPASGDPSAYWHSSAGVQSIVLCNKNQIRPTNGAKKLFVSLWVRSNVADSYGVVILYFYKAGTFFSAPESSHFVAKTTGTWYFGQTAITVPDGVDGYIAELHGYYASGSAYVDLAAPRVAVSEAHADITSLITGPGELVISSDYTGGIISGLPMTVSYRLIRSGVDVTALCSWAVTVLSGIMDASISSTTGTLTLTTYGGQLTDGAIQITASHNGIDRSLQVPVRNTASPAPAGALSGTMTIYGVLTSTTLADVTATIDVTVGGAGQAVLGAGTYQFDTTGSGSYGIYTQWYRWNGSSWVSVQSEVASEWNSGWVDLGEWGGLIYIPGFGKNTVTVTGLTADSQQQFKLRARLASGTVAQTINGTASAVGS